MPRYEVTMKNPDGDGERRITLDAADQDEARFLCEQQARALAEDDDGPVYKIARGGIREV